MLSTFLVQYLFVISVSLGWLLIWRSFYSLINLIFVRSAPGSRKHMTLKGQQMGETFGHAIAACDINGDGRDDLIVGAPTYALDQYQYNVGRVHVFVFNQDQDTLQRIRLIDY